VRTRLVGAHWVPSVLGALAAAVRCGVPMAEAAARVAAIDPFPGRLSPMPLPSGAVLLRDDYNASQPVLEAALGVLREAAARRRILVLSDFSDFEGNRKRRLRYLAERVRGAADVCVLIGEASAYGRRRLIGQGFAAEAAVACATLDEARAYLARELREGDLALLKGRTTDHVTRVAHALVGPVACRRVRCSKTVLCDFCAELRPRPGAPA
jgi:UDP-N-acetylmuramoyl-tripeptide--D-alanyl-D-alanine ligase